MLLSLLLSVPAYLQSRKVWCVLCFAIGLALGWLTLRELIFPVSLSGVEVCIYPHSVGVESFKCCPSVVSKCSVRFASFTSLQFCGLAKMLFYLMPPLVRHLAGLKAVSSPNIIEEEQSASLRNACFLIVSKHS